MASVKSKLTEEFYQETVEIRGTRYTFREISGDKYEEFLKVAEGPDGNSDLGMVLKLMIPESLVEPKLTAEQVYAKPLPVLTAIQTVVNRMHFKTEPTEPIVGETGEAAPGNESEPQTT